MLLTQRLLKTTLYFHEGSKIGAAFKNLCSSICGKKAEAQQEKRAVKFQRGHEIVPSKKVLISGNDEN